MLCVCDLVPPRGSSWTMWLQIAMADTPTMQNLQPLDDLLYNLCRSCCSLFADFDLFSQVSVGEIPHRKKDVGFILIPADK